MCMQCIECSKEFAPPRKDSKHCCVKCRELGYRKAHREEAKVRTKAWAAAHPGYRKGRNLKPPRFAPCKHCGKEFRVRTGGLFCSKSCRGKHRRITNPEWYKAFHLKHKARNNAASIARYRRVRAAAPYQTLIEMAKVRAAAKKFAFDLTVEWGSLIWTGSCAVTGIPFELGRSRRDAYSPSIDRIEPTKGYTRDNCRFVLWAINACKGSATDADVLRICKAFIKHNS